MTFTEVGSPVQPLPAVLLINISTVLENWSEKYKQIENYREGNLFFFVLPLKNKCYDETFTGLRRRGRDRNLSEEIKRWWEFCLLVRMTAASLRKCYYYFQNNLHSFPSCLALQRKQHGASENNHQKNKPELNAQLVKYPLRQNRLLAWFSNVINNITLYVSWWCMGY